MELLRRTVLYHAALQATVKDKGQKTESYGIKWVRTFWALEPRWTIEPDELIIAKIAEAALNLPSPCTVEFLARGALNKLYVVGSGDSGPEGGDSFVFRVGLPIDPKWKTESEVATLRWVRENTSLPVPRVLAHCSDRFNPIGFEWIMMEKVPGKPWADVWMHLEFSAKERVVRQIAAFCADTFQLQLHGIGSLFEAKALVSPHSNKDATPGIPVTTDTIADTTFRPPGACRGQKLGRTVSPEFIHGARGDRGTYRGPFDSTREWMVARLDSAEVDCRERLRRAQEAVEEETANCAANAISERPKFEISHSVDSSDEENLSDSSDEVSEEPEYLQRSLTIIAKLRVNLDRFFPKGAPTPEPSMIYHQDLHERNILLDEAGSLTAVVDWESLSALPLSVACQYPPFLNSKPQTVEPDKHDFWDDENGEVNEHYRRYLYMYDLTRLREGFMKEMRKLQPGWVQVFESSLRQRDFDFAVAACNDFMMGRRLLTWLGDIESGAAEVRGLEQRLHEATL